MKDLLTKGLQHEDYFVRSGSLALLADDHGTGVEATHAAIPAIERYGWEKAFEFSHMITRLPLDAEAVDRMVKWLLEDHATDPDRIPPRHHLLNWFARGPTDLFPRWTGPLGIDLEQNSEFFVDIASTRAALRSKSAGACLDLLEQTLLECAESDDFPQRLVLRMEWLFERLAEFDLPRDREIAAWLEPGAGDYHAGAALIACRHRGHLAVSVATILRLFDLDWDWLNEEVAKCLTRAAGREELLEILRLFPHLPWHARLFLCSVLEDNRHPGIEGEIARVAADEPSSDLPYRFACIFAIYGTPETREIARNMVASLPPSPEKETVHGTLYLWCRLLGEDWEELPQWRARLEKGAALLDDSKLSILAADFRVAFMTPQELMRHLAATPPCTFPGTALKEMVKRLDEMIPVLLGQLERFVEAPDSFDEDRDWLTLTTATYLLAQARETRAFKPLVALLSLSHDQVTFLWDDMISDSMGRILASVYDGDESALRGLIENPGIAKDVRGATAIQCLETLLNVGRISRNELETYYGELLETRLEKSPGLVWDGICLSISDHGFVSLLPAVERAFSEGLCAPFFNRLEDVVASLNVPGGPRNFNGTLIDDIFAELEGWECFKPGHDLDFTTDETFDLGLREENSRSGYNSLPVPPFVRESPKIGRNDPCPCGSGKKYKKCCG